MHFTFEKVPVAINALNKILSDLCRGEAHLPTCHIVSFHFHAGVEEKHIYANEQNALWKYEKARRGE